MTNSIAEHRLALLNELDRRAKLLAREATVGKMITPRIMTTINELYLSAKVEQISMGENFESAYHTAITGELEFFIARIHSHYSTVRKLEWKILLRRQESKSVPDIRIVRGEKTLAIIEIKAKGGWIQPFFSEDRYLRDKERFDKGASFNPDEMIRKEKEKLEKNQVKFNLERGDIYFLLPTLTLVHRKKYSATFDDYQNYFERTSGLPKQNYILLSKSLRLNLSGKFDQDNLQPTNDFERMLNELALK
jgi:hypothetical protein